MASDLSFNAPTTQSGRDLRAPSLNRQNALVALAVWSLLLPQVASADDWPQWRGPHRDGVWNETGILQVFPTDGLKMGWRVPVGRGWSSPIVAQGRVYVTDVQIARPTATERVLCFDEASAGSEDGRNLVARVDPHFRRYGGVHAGLL